MHRLAPALLALTTALSACADKAEPGQDTTSIKIAETKYGLGDRTVHAANQKTFEAEDGRYTLVRFEYGDTQECDVFGDCRYSTYCGFVFDGKDYPLDVYWVTEADELFDVAQYCEDGVLEGCELPGQKLPILDDPDFEDWVYETDPDEDILADCFRDYW